MKSLKSIYFILRIILGILLAVEFIIAFLYPQMRSEYRAFHTLFFSVTMAIVVAILIIRVQLGIKFKKQEIIILASIFALAILASTIVFLAAYWRIF